ncbi:WD repeat-containing protein 75-like [Zingiber officinale]|nr:WD repeat-containing protein 75-like [Zingiber officinale]
MITGGQRFVASPPAFSQDGKKLLVCTGCTVSIYSVSTGMQITELEGGHTDRVTSVVVVPVGAPSSKFMSYCWTSSLDGTICYWDFASAELIKKVKIQFPVHSMVIPSLSTIGSTEEGSNLYAFLSVEDINKPASEKKALHGQVRIYNLKNQKPVGGLLTETRNPEILYASKNGEFLGISNKRKLHIWRIPANNFRFDEIKKIKLHHTKKLTCLAFHSTLRMVAGGDDTGRILIWYNFGREKFAQNLQNLKGTKNPSDEAKPGVRNNDDVDSCTTWHWHPSEVKFLHFSSDGAYLYSGGNEGVIVVWQIDTGKKKFKPRLGSPLLYFTESPDPSLSCVSCSDNHIHLLKMPTMDISKSISGIKPPFSFPLKHEGSCTQVAFEQTTGLVAVSTEDYCVQFYSLFDNHEVSEVQVCKRNFQPADDVMLYVALVAISLDGSLMATIDVTIPEEKLGGLVCLKYWTRGSLVAEYLLSTVIYEPHSDAQVSSLAFRPGHNMAVTSSYGGDFKVWVHGSHAGRNNESMQRTGWRCQSVGSYKGKPLTAAVFSADGSILAIAAETMITLWDPDSNILVAMIGDTLSPITKLSFVGKSEYLVSYTHSLKPQLSVWSTSNLALYWSHGIVTEAVSCSHDESQFAVLALLSSPGDADAKGNGVIFFFHVEDPVPVATWTVTKAKGGSLAFLPANPSLHESSATNGVNQLLLVFMNGKHEYTIFNPHKEENIISKNSRKSQAAQDEAERLGYTSIYGDLSNSNAKHNHFQEVPFAPSERPWETIFSGSSHALPPLTKLCTSFFESLLEKRLENSNEMIIDADL